MGALLDLPAKVQRNLAQLVDHVLMRVKLGLHEGLHGFQQQAFFVGIDEAQGDSPKGSGCFLAALA